MRSWRHILRYLVSLQLLPALESGEDVLLVGGQAVVEGVMMRSPHAWGIAIRKPSGEITTHCEALERPSEKHKWLGYPFIRGLATLGQAMKLGFVASKFSLNVGLDAIAQEEAEKKQAVGAGTESISVRTEEKVEKPSAQIGTWGIAISMAFSIAFFIFMYKFVPLVAATGLKHHWSALNNNFAFN